MENKNNVQKVIESAMQNANEFSVNKIVGEPIKNESGQIVIPISNVTVAVFSGGGEYGDVKIAKEIGDHFAGGELTVCSVKPSCFVVDNGNGFSVIKSNDVLENLCAIIKSVADKLK